MSQATDLMISSKSDEPQVSKIVQNFSPTDEPATASTGTMRQNNVHQQHEAQKYSSLSFRFDEHKLPYVETNIKTQSKTLLSSIQNDTSNKSYQTSVGFVRPKIFLNITKLAKLQNSNYPRRPHDDLKELQRGLNNKNLSLKRILSNAIYLLATYYFINQHVTPASYKVGLVDCFVYHSTDDSIISTNMNTPSNQPSNYRYHNHFSINDNPTLEASETATNESSVLRVSENVELMSQDKLDTHIRKILIPRVAGTSGNKVVRDYISNTLKVLNYHIEYDDFVDNTPIGHVNFVNIIATSNVQACHQLVLACHYDSKYQQDFLGATDSAVPCAMILHLAEKFKDSFSLARNPHIGLRLIFFDGEEAFQEWSSTDSLYGSRHLAMKWSKQEPPQHCNGMKSELDRIKLFVLLDLIGAKDSEYVSLHANTRHHYQKLRKYETSLLRGTQQKHAFKNSFQPLAFIEDDHLPFQKQNVNILLLISAPFPKVWHTSADDYSAIDFPKTRRVLTVLEKFVGDFPNSTKQSRRRRRFNGSRSHL